MTAPTAEVEAQNLVDAWIGRNNIQIGTDSKGHRYLVGIVQVIVTDRNLTKKHADEGWKLANQRTAERQEILKALKALLEGMGQNIFVTHVPGTSLGAAREAAETVVEKFKPLLED